MTDSADSDQTIPPEAGSRLRSKRVLTRIGKYRVIELIGSGGNGEVYKVDAEDGFGPQALKVMALKWDIGSDAEKRFVREAMILCEADHPHIVRFRGYDFDDDPKYYVMELLEGSLWPVDRRPMAPVAAIDAMLQVLDALGYAHRLRIVHRDVKPANLLIDASGRVKLTDFGVAYFPADGRSRTRAVGTPGFTAPELEEERPRVSERADVYGAGATLLALLTARTPSSLSVADRRESELVRVPWLLRSVVARATASEPERRYGSAAELATALRRARARLLLWDRVRPRRRLTGLVGIPLALVVAGREVAQWTSPPDSAPVAIPMSAAPHSISDAPAGSNTIEVAEPSARTVAAHTPIAPVQAPIAAPVQTAPDQTPIAAQVPAPKTVKVTGTRGSRNVAKIPPPSGTSTAAVPTSSPISSSEAEPVYLYIRTVQKARFRLNGGASAPGPYMEYVPPGIHRVEIQETDEPERSVTMDIEVKPKTTKTCTYDFETGGGC